MNQVLKNYLCKENELIIKIEKSFKKKKILKNES